MTMLKRIIIFLAILCSCSGVKAQTRIEDKELASLLDVVRMLRESTEEGFNKASRILSDDVKWIPMYETGSVREGLECKASENVPGFRLNRILIRAFESRKYVSTHGDMVNGEDARYDYSLYERTLKPMAQVEYHLTGREGKQVFIIIPYNRSKALEATISCAGKKWPGKVEDDGTSIIKWETDTPSVDMEFVLSVTNGSDSPQSFVIINHNTRRK